jgi:hypothetical protein
MFYEERKIRLIVKPVVKFIVRLHRALRFKPSNLLVLPTKCYSSKLYLMPIREMKFSKLIMLIEVFPSVFISNRIESNQVQ